MTFTRGLCAMLVLSVMPAVLADPFDWAHFREHPRLRFDTHEAEYDSRIAPNELAQLKELWRQAREIYLEPAGEMGCREALEETKASWVLKRPRFLEAHVVFLKNPTRVVCMHNQFLNDNPVVMGQDGSYFGMPGDEAFNEIMEREENFLATDQDAYEFALFYLNLTSRSRMIQGPDVKAYRDEIRCRWVDEKNWNLDILEQVKPPRVRRDGDVYEVVFVTFATSALQTPGGLQRWTLSFDERGRNLVRTVEALAEREYSKGIVTPRVE